MDTKRFILCLFFISGMLNCFAQIAKQFNGDINLTTVKVVSSGNYQLVGSFSDLSGTFTASQAVVGDQIVDKVGTMVKITTITSISGSTISVFVESVGTPITPLPGIGIIFRPSGNGYPMVTAGISATLLSKATNTSTLSINSDLATFTAGSSLPVSLYGMGDAVIFSLKVYQYTSSGWTEVTGIANKYGASISVIPISVAGTIIKYYTDKNYYISDGTSWKLIPTVSELPTIPKFGDVFYETGENALYMLADDGTQNTEWMPISSGGIPSGGTVDFPTAPKAGDLFFNTDNNILYLYDINSMWVEVSSNGSNPSGFSNPDPLSPMVKEGQLFYNTSERRLFVYNGTDWLPVGNSLTNGQIFVGNSSNVATPVILSGDGVITNTGKFTVNDKAITDAKLDKSNIPLSGYGNPITDVNMGDGITNYKIRNLLNPSALQDAATKAYVDNLFANPTTTLALANGNFFVGNALNKAAAVAKSTIPLSGFGNPTTSISMNGKVITNLATPSNDADAANKLYVDSKPVYPINISLSQGMLLIGNAQDQAGMVEKKDISVSDFGAATTDISLGSFKLTAVADPVAAQDASTKNYVDTKIFPSTNIALASGNLLVGNSSGVAAATLKNAIPLSGFGAAAADISMGTSRIVSLGAPVADTDASTKKYVDDLFLSPSSILSLPAGSFFVGNSFGKATPTIKTSIPVSGFGKATETVYMGDPSTQYNISNLAEPMSGKDAATKNYVDTRIANPSSITVATDYILVGNAANQAEAVAKNTIPLNDFGAVNANLSLGNYKIINLADPVSDGDAVNKKYITTQLSNVNTLLSLPEGQLFLGNASGKAIATVRNTIPLSGFAAAVADVALGSFKLTGVADPTGDQDAATKKYVDGKTAGVTTGTTPPANPTAGTTYYNTTDKTLYVYDGSQWVPVDNKLASGQLYVGDAQNKAVATAKNTIPLSGFAAAAADVALGSFKLTGVADPSADQDAATKKYVDGKTAGVTTGTTPPANPTAGTTYYNTTDKTLYVYDGSQWVPVDNKLATGQLYVGDAQNKAVATPKNTIPLSGFAAAAADVALGSFKLTGVADPAADQDAATKKYVDDLMTSSALPALTDGKIFVGNASGKATPVSLSGDATIDNTGKMVITDDAVSAAKLNADVAGSGLKQDVSGALEVDVTTITGGSISSADLLVTGGSNAALADVSISIPDKAITDAKLDKTNIALSGFAAAAADVALGSFKLTGVADPSADQDAATKKYVDSQLATVNSALLLPQGNMLVGDANGKAASTAKGAITLSGFGDASANVSMGTGSNNYKIINLADPTGDQDASTKKYVDAKTAGVTTGTTPPANPTVGTTYYNTTDKTLYVYDGSQWVPVDNKLTSGQLYVGDANNTAISTPQSALSLSGFGVPTADLSVGSFNITNLADPKDAQDAATKKYVDDLSASSGSSALADGKIFVGNVSGVATPVSLSGDATIDNTGKMVIVDDAISAAKLNADVAGSGLKQDVSGALEVDVTTISGGSISSTDLLVTGGSNAALADVAISIPDKAITDAKLDKTNIPLSGFAAAAADVALGNFKLTGVADPAADQDAATKKYVDSKTAGVTTGTTPPANPTAGTTYYNTTDNTLYVYDGSQWVPVDNKLATGQLYVGDAQNKAVSTPKNNIPLSGFAAAAADVALGSFKLTGVADPAADQDAATKKYVDGLVAGVTSVFSLAKGNMLVGDDSGKAASTAKSAITLSGFKEAEANISMGSGSNNYKIINLADPTGNQDAATKKYVDNIGAASKDNLGNHTATEALKMGSYSVSNDGDAGDGVAFDTDGHATFGKDVTVNGDFYTPSDERLKTDIETLTNVLEKINNLRGVQFEYKDQKKYAKGPKMGVIAQELLLVYPEMVTKGDDGYLKVDYTQLTAVLIQAVKEQQQQIKQQQQDIDEMKVRLDKQQQQINSILMQLK